MHPPLPRTAAAHRPARPSWRQARAGLGPVLLMLAGLGASPLAAAESGGPLPADCALAWQVDLLPDTQPRVLRVTLSFDAGGRARSTLRLPAGWAAIDEGAENPAAPQLQAVPDEPMLRRVAHGPTGRVQLRWRHSLPASVGADERWWLFSGQAVLPVPDELEDRPPAVACISLTGPAAGGNGPTVWLSSHGAVAGPSALWRLPANGDSLRSRVQQALYAGGAWQLQALTVEGQALTVARPDSPALGLALPALAQAGSQALAAQRRHWGETLPGPAWMLWALPVAQRGAPGSSGADGAGGASGASGASGADGADGSAWGSAWQQTAVVQVAGGAALAPAKLDGAIAQALNRLWLRDRFGPLVQAGRDDEPVRRWFSEGVADFLAHQALLRQQRWSAADLAKHYKRQIERWADPNPPGQAATDPAALDAAAARGEWLALQWHALLRAQGQPGLEALMRHLLLPAAQARHEGPISAPLATHRLVAALRARLGDLPLREVQRVVDRGEPAWVYPDTLAACFSIDQPTGQRLGVQARPEALQQAACQGWLGLGPEALSAQRSGPSQALADTRAPQAAAPRSAKAGVRAAGKSDSHSKGAKASGKAGAKAAGKPAGNSRRR